MRDLGSTVLLISLGRLIPSVGLGPAAAASDETPIVESVGCTLAIGVTGTTGVRGAVG